MEAVLFAAQVSSWLISVRGLFALIQLVGIACFCYIVRKRLEPMLAAERDPRFDRPWLRTKLLLKYWFAQWKQPRYPLAGVLHIVIFIGFILLSINSISLVLFGISPGLAFTNGSNGIGLAYNVMKDYAATAVFIAVLLAAVRRAVFTPARYAPAPGDKRDHTAEALLVLGLIALLMFSESLFAASGALLGSSAENIAPAAPLTLAWMLERTFAQMRPESLVLLHRGSYLAHDLLFFAFLCFLPFGKHFHVVTSLFNVYFGKLERGTVKPVKWGVADEQIDQVKAFDVKKFEDFTWKHILDFYTCADCGRCSDKCPANAAGRPLSPRFLSIKARDYAFEHFPVFGKANNSHALVGSVYSEDEIWSCTTCGQCEEECPLLIEYIDKIVDLRRGMVDEGNVPQTLQKPLKALESRGNPYGKLEKKRADWAKDKEFTKDCEVKILDGKTAETLFFVDSVTSYDDRIQAIGRATARILDAAGQDFGILGAAEKDSGHEVRRFGEELLFMALRDQNVEAIKNSGAKRIVTADPHALNALKHDYKNMPPVEHISQTIARELKRGKLKLQGVDDPTKIYTYHDPCYLGRHNQIYDEPRAMLDAIPGLKRVEMDRCRDRSFCCGGGGLMLFYEPKENERMGVLRVKMAAEAGANVIVTACPFCMVNIEDAIKVTGMEGKMTAIDLTELVDQQLVRGPKAYDDCELTAALVNGD